MTADLVAFLTARLDDQELDADDWHSRDCSTGSPPPGPFPCDCTVPTWVLADVAAKRRVVELAQGVGVVDGVAFDMELLEALAQPFADHPDFDPAWRV